jgi:hypothetical protein
MGPEEKAKVWKEFMSSPLAKVVYTAYYHDNYERKGNMEIGEYLKRHSIESIVHTSEMMNLLVHGYEARTLAEKPTEESQMGPKGDPQWLDEPNHPKDGSAKWYWVKTGIETEPNPMLVYRGVNGKWLAKDTNISSHWDGSRWQPNGAIFPLGGCKVLPIQEPS